MRSVSRAFPDSVHSLRKNGLGTDGRGLKSPLPPSIPVNPERTGNEREWTGRNGAPVNRSLAPTREPPANRREPPRSEVAS